MKVKKFQNYSIVLLVVLTSACKTLPNQYVYPGEISEYELISGVTFLGSALNNKDLPDIDVMAVSEEMSAFLERHVSNASNHETKAKKLSNAIFNNDGLGLKYNPGLTMTAIETFDYGAGNCLSFSYLVFAMAQDLGLNVQFQETDILPEWDYTNDEIYVESRHINVRVNLYGKNDLIVDIDSVGPDRQLNYTLLDESYVLALFYGNVAAEYLLKQDFESSFKYFVKAIKTDYEESSFWTNLGVLYRRDGYEDHAEKAYFTALSFNPKDKAALNNLSFLNTEQGNKERADYFGQLVEKYQESNPYFRYVKAQKAMEENQYNLALDHINQAIRQKDNEARIYSLKGTIFAAIGKKREAERALGIAEQLKIEAL
ncbi:hypothetical protein OAQ01_05240 [Emcibacteraceae bacterium]|nr:hypothetical protein [Emcibacteraceae bacterium]